MDECMTPIGLNLTKDSARYMNNRVFIDYYLRLKELALSKFEWINLPDTCDARFLELILFEFGYCLFFQHDLNKSFFTLQCAISGPLNMYRIPIERRAYAVTGFTQQCDDTNSVIIFNNMLRMPTSPTIELYARRLTDIERTIAVNVNAQKTPMLLLGTQAQQKSLKAIYSKYDGNIPVIFGDKDITLNQITAVNTEAPERYLNLQKYKQQVWNEAIAFLGYNTTDTTKRERMITDEVNSNNQLIAGQTYTQLVMRKQACDFINGLFALDLKKEVDVRVRQITPDVSPTMAERMMDDGLYGGTSQRASIPDRDG